MWFLKRTAKVLSKLRSAVISACALSMARWVSTQWLKQWADSESCDALDNGPIVCVHGKLAPDKVTGQTPLQYTCS